MDRAFMFFDSRTKKGPKKVYNHSNHSRSHSAKNQPIKTSARLKAPQKTVLTKRQRQIRQAIEYRFARSRMRDYTYATAGSGLRENRKASHSSQMQEYKHLKKCKVLNLKEYQDKPPSHISSTKSTKYTMRFKLRENSSTIFRTEGSEAASKEKYFTKHLDRTASEFSRKKDEWKFISIQLKGEEKSKTKKVDMRINSHRTLNVDRNHSKSKTKSTDKYWQKIPKFNDLSRLNRQYRF